MANWKAQSLSGIERRVYADYAEYFNHQRAKLPTLDAVELAQFDAEYRELLVGRLREHDIVEPGMSVLCLGARTGGEVCAFWDLGCFAVGVDANPGEANTRVVTGDFHELQFPEDSVDVIFTNSLDHIYDLGKVLTEIKRVLKPLALLILEIPRGTKEGRKPGKYESCSWRRIDDILTPIKASGFELLSRTNIHSPGRGQHICLQSTQSYSIRG